MKTTYRRYRLELQSLDNFPRSIWLPAMSANSSGRRRFRRADLCQRKVRKWDICISKPITKPFGSIHGLKIKAKEKANKPLLYLPYLTVKVTYQIYEIKTWRINICLFPEVITYSSTNPNWAKKVATETHSSTYGSSLLILQKLQEIVCSRKLETSAPHFNVSWTKDNGASSVPAFPLLYTFSMHVFP